MKEVRENRAIVKTFTAVLYPNRYNCIGHDYSNDSINREF